MQKIVGVVFSDLGKASSFMALDWVKQALERALGFAPYPATLNVRPKEAQDARAWQALQADSKGIPLQSVDGGFCSARLYPIAIRGIGNGAGEIRGAILLPEVGQYPRDKIELVLPIRLKTEFGVQDGDQLTLEWLG